MARSWGKNTASPTSAEGTELACQPARTPDVSNSEEAAQVCLTEASETPWLDGVDATPPENAPLTWADPSLSQLATLPADQLMSTLDESGADVDALMSSPEVQGAATEAEAKEYMIQLLVGGAYTDANGKEHPFGHTAVRLVDGENSRDMIYDFGRYGRTNGEFSAEGEGILRKWDGAYDEYIENQNANGRETLGYSFPVTKEQYEAALAYATSLEEGSEGYSGNDSFADGGRRDVRKLTDDYHGLTNNCTTLSVDIAEAGMPGTDFDVSQENDGTGLSAPLKMAARFQGWPEDIFMPADLGSVLDGMAQRNDDIVVEHWDPAAETPYRRLQPNAEPAQARP